jgi:hypothetical protein
VAGLRENDHRLSLGRLGVGLAGQSQDKHAHRIVTEQVELDFWTQR